MNNVSHVRLPDDATRGASPVRGRGQRGPARLPGGKPAKKPKRPRLLLDQTGFRGCLRNDTRYVTLQLPLELKSEQNLREHWTATAKRKAAQRGLVRLFRQLASDIRLPVQVTLIRIAPRKLDDDNLRASFKHVRDGVADILGVSDNAPAVEWKYDQIANKPNTYGCSIFILENR